MTPIAPAPTEVRVTSSPSATPNSTVSIVRGGTSPRSSWGRRARDEGVDNDGNRAQGKCNDEAHPDPAPEYRSIDVEIGDGRKQQRSGRKTSRREPEHDRRVDVIGKMVAPAPSRLGDRSIEQVGTDRDLRADPKTRDQ